MQQLFLTLWNIQYTRAAGVNQHSVGVQYSWVSWSNVKWSGLFKDTMRRPVPELNWILYVWSHASSKPHLVQQDIKFRVKCNRRKLFLKSNFILQSDFIKLYTFPQYQLWNTISCVERVQPCQSDSRVMETEIQQLKKDIDKPAWNIY